MTNSSPSLINVKTLILPTALAVLLILSRQNSFILFHTLAEFFAIVVAILTTVVAWQMYSFTRNHFLMYLGCGYFWVAALDMMHALSYKGMPIFEVTGTDMATQFWIGTRYLESILLLSAPWFLTHSLRRNLVFTLFSFGAIALSLLIFSGNFPVAFIEGQGLTKFKVYSEYVIVGILVLAIVYLARQKKFIDQRVFALMIASMVFTMMAELAFTFYIDLYGLSNLAGHILKIFSFWLIFIAVVRTTLREPFSALSKAETYYDAVPDATVIVNEENVIQNVNKMACSLANKSSIELVGQNVHVVYHGVDDDQNNCPACKAVKERAVLSSYEVKLNDVMWLDVSVNPIDDEGNFIEVIRDISDIKNSASALIKSKAHLHTLIETLPDLVWLKDPDGVFLSCNQKVQHLYGADKDEILGKTDYDFADKATADFFREKDKLVIESGQSHRNEEELTFSDGHKALVETIKTPIYDDNDQLIGVLGVARDITERKRTYEIMHDVASGVSTQVGEVFFQSLAKHLVSIFDVKYVLIGLLDKQLVNTINTVAICVSGKIIGNTTYKLKDTPCDHVINGNDSVVRSYASNVQELFPNDTMLVDMDVQSYIGSPLIGANGEHIGLIIVMDNKPMESTEQVESILQIFAVRAAAELERVEIEESLKNKSQLLIDAQRISHIGSWEWDLINNKMSWSDEMCCVLGLCSDECNATYEKIISIIHPDDQERVRQAYTDSVKNKTHCNINYRLLMQDGSIKNVYGRCETFYDDDGIPVRSNGTVQDITTQVVMEETIRRTQKMDALGKLTGGVAHDYNNMLGVVMGYAELLERGLSEEPKLASYAHEIHHAGERGARLTKKLLSFSRTDESDVEKLNLNTLLQDQQHMLEKTLTVRIKLVLDLEDGLWPIWVNDNDMEDAILNLSINAMHAMEGKGELTIQTRNRKINHDEAELLNLTSGDYILFSITDTGIGMDKEMMNKIFEPFFTTKGEKGTGLGLSQVYGFVQRSRGVAKVYSEPDHGSQFVLYFPRYNESGHDEKVIDDLFVADASSSATILVVDDEKALRDLTCEILEQNGFTVIATESAEKALLVLDHESVDLMISDVIMPEVDGYQLASIVMQKYPSIKIQLVSGFTDERNLSIIDEILRQNLLYKPFGSKALLQRIHELLN